MTFPQTLAGLWLRALVLGQRELREELSARMHDEDGTIRRSDVELIHACLETFACDYFTNHYDVRQVTAFVSDMMRTMGSKAPDSLEAEAIIRSVLGETDVMVSDINPLTVYLVSAIGVWLIVRQHGLDGSYIDRAITASERLATDRGWLPTPGQNVA